jgi:hypothetical protein
MHEIEEMQVVSHRGPCQERSGSLIQVCLQDQSLQGITDQLKAHAIFIEITVRHWYG